MVGPLGCSMLVCPDVESVHKHTPSRKPALPYNTTLEWTCQHVYDWLGTVEDLDEGIAVVARSNKVDGRYSHLLHSAFA